MQKRLNAGLVLDEEDDDDDVGSIFWKKNEFSNQDIFMSFWIYKNSFRIRGFQPETSKNRCLLVDPDFKKIFLKNIF